MLNWLRFLLVELYSKLSLVSPLPVQSEHLVQKVPDVMLLGLKLHQLLLIHGADGAFKRCECNSRSRGHDKLFCHHLLPHRAKDATFTRVLLVYYFLYKMFKFSQLREIAKRALDRHDTFKLRYSRGFLLNKRPNIINSDGRNACQWFALVTGVRQVMCVRIALVLHFVHWKYSLPR